MISRTPTPEGEIREDYTTQAPCYKSHRTITPQGIMVHSTACPGVTARELRASWDSPGGEAMAHAVLDDMETIQCLPWERRAWHCGAAANNTHISFECCEPPQCRLLPIEWVPLYRGNAQMPVWAIKRWQQELRCMGLYKGQADGSFGPATQDATRAAQRQLDLDPDGSCGRGTLRAAAAQPGSLMRYDPQECKLYFEAMWRRAVALAAQLCQLYHLDPLRDILCHSEGYQRGIASNHADVLHWWPEHGKTMDDFRAAVARALDGDKPAQHEPWYAADVSWAVSRGITDGSDPERPATRAEVCAMLHRYDDGRR